MANIYVIRDTKMKADTFTFLQNHHGAAASYFYNWGLMQNHREFALYVIGQIDSVDDFSSDSPASEFVLGSIERTHLFDMPSEEDHEQAKRAKR